MVLVSPFTERVCLVLGAINSVEQKSTLQKTHLIQQHHEEIKTVHVVYQGLIFGEDDIEFIVR